MVKILGRNKEKKEKEMDFKKGLVLTEQSRQTLTPEYVDSLGRSVYMIYDEEVIKLLEENDLNHLIPALSFLNRVTSEGKQSVEIDMLDLEAIFLKEKILMEEETYEEKTCKLLDTLQFFANHIPTDAFEGFKAKLLAYQMKVIRTELEEKKKRGIL